MKHLYTNILLFTFMFISLSSTEAQQYIPKANDVVFQEVQYQAGKTRIKLDNNCGEKMSLLLRAEIIASETEEESIIYEQTFNFKGKVKTLTIEDQAICRAKIMILNRYYETIATYKLSQGEWMIHNPEDLFYKKFFVEERQAPDNAYIVERNLLVVPKLYNKVYVTRNLQSRSNQISFEQYDELQFKSEELDELKITFVCKDDEYELFLDGIEDGSQSIEITHAKNKYGEPCNLIDLESIKFELKGYNLAKPIRLIDMQFYQNTTRRQEQVETTISYQVFPNPTNGFVNIQMDKPGTYSFDLYDANKRVFHQDVEIDKSTQLRLPELPKGMYYYKISNGFFEASNRLIIL